MIDEGEMVGRRVTRAAMAARLRSIRREFFGEGGGDEVARRLGLPSRTWKNYESGVTIPGEVILRFLILTGTDPRRMLAE